MKKLLLILAFFVVPILFLSACSNSQPTEEKAKTILFVGKGCPHCEIVEEFVEKNKIAEKIEFTVKESFTNKNNAQLLLQKGKECNLEKNNLGAVPLLWDEGQCFVGDKDIIDYLKKKANVSE